MGLSVFLHLCEGDEGALALLACLIDDCQQAAGQIDQHLLPCFNAIVQGLNLAGQRLFFGA